MTVLPALALAATAAASVLTVPGRPPIGPLDRLEPRRYEVTQDIQLSTNVPFQPRRIFEDDIEPRPYVNDPWGDQFDLLGGEIVFPVSVLGTYHRLDLGSLDAQLALDNGRTIDVNETGRVAEGLPFGVQRAIIPLPQAQCELIRVTFRQTVDVWNTTLDDAAAITLPWPERFPAEVADGLRPSLAIESDDPIFADVVSELFGGQVTSSPPLAVAKTIAGHVAATVQIARPEVYRGPAGAIDGLVISGARTTLSRGFGSPGDVACLTVALMRAAGLPARPVVGVFRDEEEDDRDELDIWAEFYLDGAGWVPFDPERLQRNRSWTARGMDESWPDFGTWDDLHDRIPISYELVPTGYESMQRPAIYGWRPDPPRQAIGIQYVNVDITSRGPVREDG